MCVCVKKFTNQGFETLHFGPRKETLDAYVHYTCKMYIIVIRIYIYIIYENQILVGVSIE
jgi:hypothetical protein